MTQAFAYAAEGYPALREIPAHGWHENLLKGSNRVFGQGPRRAILFPMPFPEAVPPGFVKTPEEEFRFNNRFFIDRALAEGSRHVTLIWHPWSLALFDPGMRMLELTFRYVRERDLEPSTFGDFDERLRA